MHRSPLQKLGSLTTVACLAMLLQGCVAGFGHDLFGPPPATSAEEEGGDSRLRVARRTAESGDLAVAASLYRAMANDEPRSVVVRVELAQVLEELRRYRAAAATWDEVVALEPDFPEWRGRQVGALLSDNSPLAALERAEDGLAATGEPAELLGLAGVAASLVGRPETAEDYFLRANRAEPNDPDLLANYAYFLIQQGRPGEAAGLLERAVELPGAGPRHRQNLALAYGLLGREDEAARLLRRDLGEDEAGRRLAEWRRLRTPVAGPDGD